jgi:hypothetical protein
VISTPFAIRTTRPPRAGRPDLARVAVVRRRELDREGRGSTVVRSTIAPSAFDTTFCDDEDVVLAERQRRLSADRR